MDIVKGTIIYLEDEQYFTLPSNVTKVRLEVHGGRGGRGGDAYDNKKGSPGSNGSRISCILDLSKVPTPSRTLYAVKGHNGANGGYGSWSAGGGGGGGSSAILLGDILIIQAQGGAGRDGGFSVYGSYGSYGAGGKGGKGYVNGKDGTSGSSSNRGIGGAGGGSDYIFEGLERVDATIEYTPGLLLLEVLEVKPILILIKSNNKYYTYQNNEFIEVEPTVENFKKKSILLSDLITPTNKVVLTMEEGEDLGDGKIFRKSINADKYGYIEGLTTQEM